MAAIQQAIRENDSVELSRRVGKWPAGTGGTAVSDYGDVKLVEIADESGRTQALLRVPESQLTLSDAHRR